MKSKQTTIEHVDVLIIGAGLSGIGLAYYLQRDRPQDSFQIFESRQTLGGTWDLFKYPGIRSDSDLFTFGYEFKPWKDKKSIADASTILSYLNETVVENNIKQKICFNSKVISADWNSEQAKWIVQLENTQTKQTFEMTCNWVFSAAGYYRYDQGFTPVFKGLENYQGLIIHPQLWPEDLDYSDKRVLVIGSGATAVTLVPAMSDKATHVTMLQRTPTYVISMPAKDPIANLIRKILPEEQAYKWIRTKNINISRSIWKLSQKYPNGMRKVIRYRNKKLLPEGYAVDKHFNPPYNPWEQRLCSVPDGDLFKAINKGKATIVTDRIEKFTQEGVLLESGQELKADIIITATGLNMQLFGGIQFKENGQEIQISEKIAYKGMLLSDIPNFAFSIGYTNSSWTLKVGLLCEHFCRILSEMERQGKNECRAEVLDKNMPTRPLLDFGAGYIQRAVSTFPKQGDEAPWLMSMDYYLDVKYLRDGSVLDPHLKFSSIKSTDSELTNLNMQKEA